MGAMGAVTSIANKSGSHDWGPTGDEDAFIASRIGAIRGKS
jgi:hypothetical protein